MVLDFISILYSTNQGPHYVIMYKMRFTCGSQAAPSSSGDEEDDASGARARRRRLAVLAFADEFAARQVAQLVSEFEGYPAVVVRFERDVVLEWVRAGGETEQGEMGGGWRASTASGGEVHRCDDADNDGAADGDGDGDAIFVVGVVG